MSDTQSKTVPEGSVIYSTKLHWIIFFGPVCAFFIALTLIIQFWHFRSLGFIFAAFSLCWIFMTWLTYTCSSITIQKKQVIVRTGILVRQTVDIPLGKIETIDIRQSVLGSIMRYGTLIITGTGGTRHFINFLSRPLTCRRYIEQLMNE